MRFQVPQFIETETKIVGPFTLKQFLWVAGGGSILFLMFMILPLIAFIVLSIPVAIIFGSLAFIKIDNVPLFNYFVYSIAYIVNPRRYFFKKESAHDFNRPNREEAPEKIKNKGKEIKKEEEEEEKEKKDDDDLSGGYIENEYIVR